LAGFAVTILITNDDGIAAEGLRALREALRPFGRVITVAPDREQSATSHAITLHRPLRIRPVDVDTYSVDGTPTDCVLAAMNGLLEERPSLVVSGINHGPNMGDDVTYSGTVSAAFEGAILEVPSIAVSLATFGPHDFRAAMAVVPAIVEAVHRHGLPPRALLNVNVPSGPPEVLRGTRVTRLGHRVYGDALEKRHDPRGREYYWIGGHEPAWRPEPDSDFLAVHEGFVSVTPLSLDLTHGVLFESMGEWTFDGYGR
jgi:5'-nucleotidase